jgi:hypothetical protein
MRQDQLQRMLVHLQRSVAEEIRQSVKAVETRLEQVAIAKQQLGSREKTYEDLKLQWGSDAVTAFQIVDAKLKMIEARAELVHHVVAWEIAHVKLKQAQGIFALECGYTEPAEGFHPAVFLPAASAPQAEEGPVTEGPPPTPPSLAETSPDLRQPDSLHDTAAGENIAAEDPSPRPLPAPRKSDAETPRPVKTADEPPRQADDGSSDQPPKVPGADDSGDTLMFPRDPAVDTRQAPAPVEASLPPANPQSPPPAPLEPPAARDDASPGTEEPRAPQDKLHSDVPPDDIFELDDTFLLDKTSRLRQPDSLRVKRMFTIELTQPESLKTHRLTAAISHRKPAGGPACRRPRPTVHAGFEHVAGPSEAGAYAVGPRGHGPSRLRQPESVTHPGL